MNIIEILELMKRQADINEGFIRQLKITNEITTKLSESLSLLHERISKLERGF